MVIRMGCVGFVLMLSSAAEASTVLSSSRLAIGLNTDGSLVTDERDVGIVYDPEGGSVGDPVGSDLILPGYPFETWTAEWSSGRQTNGGPHLDGGLRLNWGATVDNGFVNTATATGSMGDVDVDITYDLPWDLDVLWIEMTLTANREISDVWVVRTVDPDLDATFETYRTVNVSDGAIVTASARYAGKAMALASQDGISGVCSGWCTRARDVTAGAGQSETDDSVVGVAVDVGRLAKGEQRTVVFAYGFGLTADDARTMADWAITSPDRDGDGLTEADGDCDDRDPWVYPDAEEWPDGADNDCDGQVDEGTSIFDDDGDGFSEEDGDCDDDDDRVYPGAEPVDDVPDADCDGEADAGSWGRDDEKPENWGQDEQDEGIEIVSGGCVTAPLPIWPWMCVPILVRIRRKGGAA